MACDRCYRGRGTHQGDGSYVIKKEALETYCPERKVDFRTMLDSADYFLSREKQTEVIMQIDQMYNHREKCQSLSEDSKKISNVIGIEPKKKESNYGV